MLRHIATSQACRDYRLKITTKLTQNKFKIEQELQKNLYPRW